MNDLRPELLDRLAGEYVLGTLHGGARRRFQKLMQFDPAMRAAVALWETRMHGLAASVPARAPRSKVWAAIEARTRPGRSVATQSHAPAPSSSSWLGDLLAGWWRPALGVAFGVLMVLGLLRVAPDAFVSVDQVAQREQAMPQSYVGLLLDAQGRPALLVSSTRHGKRVSVKSLRPLEVPAGKVLQVWAFPREAGAPFPIGVATGAKPPGSTSFELSDTSEALLSKVAQLGVSLEDAPVTAGAQPQEPLLLKGHCVKLW